MILSAVDRYILISSPLLPQEQLHAASCHLRRWQHGVPSWRFSLFGPASSANRGRNTSLAVAHATCRLRFVRYIMQRALLCSSFSGVGHSVTDPTCPTTFSIHHAVHHKHGRNALYARPPTFTGATIQNRGQPRRALDTKIKPMRQTAILSSSSTPGTPTYPANRSSAWCNSKQGGSLTCCWSRPPCEAALRRTPRSTRMLSQETRPGGIGISPQSAR